MGWAELVSHGVFVGASLLAIFWLGSCLKRPKIASKLAPTEILVSGRDRGVDGVGGCAMPRLHDGSERFGHTAPPQRAASTRSAPCHILVAAIR